MLLIIGWDRTVLYETCGNQTATNGMNGNFTSTSPLKTQPLRDVFTHLNNHVRINWFGIIQKMEFIWSNQVIGSPLIYPKEIILSLYLLRVPLFWNKKYGKLLLHPKLNISFGGSYQELWVLDLNSIYEIFPWMPHVNGVILIKNLPTTYFSNVLIRHWHGAYPALASRISK